jgi:hypothetical protein
LTFAGMLALSYVCLTPVYALQVLFEKRIGFRYTEMLLGVHQIDELQVAIPPSEVFEILLAELSSLKFVGLIRSEPFHGYILIRTKLTGKSFGEEVKIVVDSSDSTSSLLSLSSQPIISTTLFDYGKNSENMQIIRTAIRDAEKKYLEQKLIQ